MAYDINSFRFANPTTPQQTAFNSTIGLGGQNNVNQAYSQFLTGANNPNAAQQLGQAWGAQYNDPSTNPDQLHNILGTYEMGGNNLLGAGYGLTAPNAGTHGGQQARQAAMIGNQPGYTGGGFNNPATGVPSTTSGTPLSSMVNPSSTPASTASVNPATGQPATPPDYSTYITDPSAYLDPSMQFTMDQGMNQLKNAAGASGNLLSGQTLKGITDYSQGVASQGWQNAFNNAQTDANRLYGIDNSDRNFAYNADVNDRNFNNSNQQFLAQMGMQGTNANSSLSQALAAILSNNSIAAGQAQGAGTVGANNALTGSLSSIIGQLYQNNMLSQYAPGGTVGGI